MILRGRASPLRTCDKCGAQRNADKMRVISGRWICDWHESFVAKEVLNQAPLTTFPVKPFKGAKPFAPNDTFQHAEEELFNFLLAAYTVDAQSTDQLVGWVNTPAATTTSSQLSTGVNGAAWSGIYFYELITENLRPVAMVNRAKVALRAIADFLLTKIAGYPGRASVFSSADFQWGGFEITGILTNSAGFYYLEHAAPAGLALLRAYQVHGDTKYLDAARAVAWFCRSCQCPGYAFVNFTASDAAGTARLHTGAHTLYLSKNAGTTLFPSNDFYPSGLIALEFLQAFKAAVGDEVIGSSVTGVTNSSFVSSREITVSGAIAEAKAFWATGILDSGTGTVINGFTSSRPFQFFDAYDNTPGGTGAWRYSDGSAAAGSSLTGINWAYGLRGLRAVDGDSAQVTGLFDWLMTFTSNTVNQLPVKYSEKTLWAGFAGTYDPTQALAVNLRVRDVTTGAALTMETAGSSYHLGTTGLLAGLYTSRQQASFAAFKATLCDPKPFSRTGLEDGRTEYLALMGRSGLAFQPRVATNTSRRRDVYAAAMTGLIYRQAPKAFLGRGHAQ